MAEPTWDSSSDTSYSHERESSNSTRSASPLPIREGDVKILEGGQTFILTHGEEPKRSTKRRQSSHRREFHNVPSQLLSIFPHSPLFLSSYRGILIKLIFKPQYSTLDRSNPISAASPFIGFYTLFWLGLGFFMVRTFLYSYRTTGPSLMIRG